MVGGTQTLSDQIKAAWDKMQEDQYYEEEEEAAEEDEKEEE